MEANILVGGPKQFWPANFEQLATKHAQDFIWVGADQGAVALCELGISPNLAIGDFDSASSRDQFLVQVRAQKIIAARSEKDYTDTQLAVLMTEKYFPWVDKINIYGATGGRLDHLLANIFLVLGSEFEHLATKVRLFDCQNSVSFYLPGEYQLLKEAQMTYLAFIPLTAVKDLSLFNTKYRLAKAKFNRPISLASNEFMEEKAHFAFSEGVVCVIQSRD